MSFYRFSVIDKWSSDLLQSLKPDKFEKVKTDTWVFRLHYRVSFWLLFVFAVAYVYVGGIKVPMRCIASMKSVNRANGQKHTYGMGAFHEEVTDYCYSSGTYVVLNADPDREMFPGVVGVTGVHDQIYYHQYYKWLPIYIIVMHVLLILPRYIWRQIEGGIMKSIVEPVRANRYLLHKKDLANNVEEQAVEFLHCHFGYFKRYAFGFVFCEILNVVVTVSILLLWDYISDHELWMNGASLKNLMSDPSQRTDRMAKVFPILAKCTFNIYGVSGNIEPHGFVCSLPMNAVTERAVVFFWYYFILLLILGIGSLVFRLMAIVVRPLRTRMLEGSVTMVSPKQMLPLSDKCSYSDWFFIRQFSSCIEPVIFREVIEKLIAKIENEV